MCSCLSPFLHYFRHTAFVVSLLYRISLLKLRFSAADPRDIKAPCPHLLPVRGDQNRQDARLAITPTVTPLPNTTHSTPTPGIYMHVPCSPCTHTCQSSAYCKSINPLNIRYMPSRVSLSFLSSALCLSFNSPQLRGHMALIPRESPRSDSGHRC